MFTLARLCSRFWPSSLVTLRHARRNIGGKQQIHCQSACLIDQQNPAMVTQTQSSGIIRMQQNMRGTELLF